MAKPDNQFKSMAKDAADRLDRAREANKQLQLLPDEPETGALIAAPAEGGRGKGKATQSQVRQWLAARGYRLPEDVLAEMAGLASSYDAFTTAMMRAEQVMLWAGATLAPKGRIELFLQLYAAQLRAADALMPYGAAKVSSDAPPPAAVQVNVIGHGAPQQAPARVAQGADGRRIAPPPLPGEVQQNQGVEDAETVDTDGDIRTEGPSN